MYFVGKKNQNFVSVLLMSLAAMGFCDVGVQSLIVKVLSDGLDPVKGDLIEVF